MAGYHCLMPTGIFYCKMRPNLIAYGISSSETLQVRPNAPLKGGNEPPAQGNSLGNKGNITDGALTGQKRYRWEKNAFAPPGRNYHTAYKTQGVALGYMIVGLSGRRSTGML